MLSYYSFTVFFTSTFPSSFPKYEFRLLGLDSSLHFYLKFIQRV